jgi:hypothetical protein
VNPRLRPWARLQRPMRLLKPFAEAIGKAPSLNSFSDIRYEPKKYSSILSNRAAQWASLCSPSTTSQ